MEYIIKAEEKEKVMMEIWKQFDKAFSPNNREAEAINSQLSVEYIMEEKDMLSHVNSTFCKKRF